MANIRCPIKGREACSGPICGHCPSCRRTWDEHNGLNMAAKPAQCPARGHL